MKLKNSLSLFSYYPPLSGMHRHNPPKLLPTAVLENQWFGTKFHSRTDESRFCRLLRF